MINSIPYIGLEFKMRGKITCFLRANIAIHRRQLEVKRRQASCLVIRLFGLLSYIPQNRTKRPLYGPKTKIP